MKLALRSSAIWLCFLVIAFMNGAFREFVLIKRIAMTPYLANQISCYTGAISWTTLLLFLWRKLEIKNYTQAACVGAGWLLSTALFETFVMNRNLTWKEIAHTYDVKSGEYWGLVLLWLGLMPLVIYSLSLFGYKRNNLYKHLRKTFHIKHI